MSSFRVFLGLVWLVGCAPGAAPETEGPSIEDTDIGKPDPDTEEPSKPEETDEPWDTQIPDPEPQEPLTKDGFVERYVAAVCAYDDSCPGDGVYGFSNIPACIADLGAEFYVDPAAELDVAAAQGCLDGLEGLECTVEPVEWSDELYWANFPEECANVYRFPEESEEDVLAFEWVDAPLEYFPEYDAYAWYFLASVNGEPVEVDAWVWDMDAGFYAASYTMAPHETTENYYWAADWVLWTEMDVYGWYEVDFSATDADGNALYESAPLETL